MQGCNELLIVCSTEHQSLDLLHGASFVDLGQLISPEDPHHFGVNLSVELVSFDKNFNELLTIRQNDVDNSVLREACDFTQGTQHVFVISNLLRLGIDDLLNNLNASEQLFGDF